MSKNSKEFIARAPNAPDALSLASVLGRFFSNWSYFPGGRLAKYILLTHQYYDAYTVYIASCMPSSLHTPLVLYNHHDTHCTNTTSTTPYCHAHHIPSIISPAPRSSSRKVGRQSESRVVVAFNRDIRRYDSAARRPSALELRGGNNGLCTLYIIIIIQL